MHKIYMPLQSLI